MNVDPHYYGQGGISLAEIDPATNALGPFVWVGDVSAFTTKYTTDDVTHKESNTGQKGLTDSFTVGVACDFDMTMHQISPANLARVLRSTVVNTTAGSATAESLGATVAAGDQVRLANPGVSDVVITDSTGTPQTLVEGTDYTVDANFGKVTILNIGTYVQPFKAAYSYKSRSAVGMFTVAQKKYALKYEGYNLAESNQPVIVDLYKVAPKILQELAWITTGNDVAGMPLSGSSLQDITKPATGSLGQYGSVTQVNAA